MDGKNPETHGSESYGARLLSKAPVCKRNITTREKILVLKSSKLHGTIFPPWDADPEPPEFQCSSDHASFVDGTKFRLSNVQLEMFCCWRRPGEAPSEGHACRKVKSTMEAEGKVDLVQDVTTDCSVVASLCAIRARTEKGHSDILLCNLYPQKNNPGQPAASANGKYVVRLYFNGCNRRVNIDNLLPTSRSSRTLHVVDRNQPGLLWPALVEKAYLKVRGGYDFPGSNSGTDIWVMTGWIPEQIFLQSDETALEHLWRRIYNAFKYGDILITVGTGKLSQREQEELGLAGEHDYAIIDMKELEGQPLLLVKNPWSEGTVWKGRVIHDETTSNQIQGLCIAAEPCFATFKHAHLSPGTFWMSLNDIFQNFESMYFNWNPCLFDHRQDVHFNWDLSKYERCEGSFVCNPQYTLRSSISGTVWMLLSRHLAPDNEKVVDHEEQSSSTTATIQGFISLYGFNNHAERVELSDGATARSPYVDSPNTLLKVELSANESLTVVVSEQALPGSSHIFTLSAYSSGPLFMDLAKERYTYNIQRDGAWTPSTAGGNASSALYHHNPQFSITLAKASDIRLVVETPTQGIAVHVKLIWANGRRIRSISTRDIAGDSGEYRKGSTVTNIRDIPSGTYTVVCSTFEQGQLGNFTLRVSSMAACVVKQASAATAGRFVMKVNAAEFTPGVGRLAARLTSPRLNRLSVIARSRMEDSANTRDTQSPLKVAIEYGQGPTKRVLTVSGNDDFFDSPMGVTTSDVDVQPKMCTEDGVWIALERLPSSGHLKNEMIDIEIHSEGAVELGRWIM